MGNTVETIRDAGAGLGLTLSSAPPVMSRLTDEAEAVLMRKNNTPSPALPDDASSSSSIASVGGGSLFARRTTAVRIPENVDDDKSRSPSSSSRGGGNDDVERGTTQTNSRSASGGGGSVQQTISGYFRATTAFAVVLLIVDGATFAVAMSTQTSRPRVLSAPQIAIVCVGFMCAYVSIAALLGIAMYFAARARATSTSTRAKSGTNASPPPVAAVHGFWDPLTNFVAMLVSMFSGATVALSMLLMFVQATKIEQ